MTDFYGNINTLPRTQIIRAESTVHAENIDGSNILLTVIIIRNIFSYKVGFPYSYVHILNFRNIIFAVRILICKLRNMDM